MAIPATSASDTSYTLDRAISRSFSQGISGSLCMAALSGGIVAAVTAFLLGMRYCDCGAYLHWRQSALTKPFASSSPTLRRLAARLACSSISLSTTRMAAKNAGQLAYYAWSSWARNSCRELLIKKSSLVLADGNREDQDTAMVLGIDPPLQVLTTLSPPFSLHWLARSFSLRTADRAHPRSTLSLDRSAGHGDARWYGTVTAPSSARSFTSGCAAF